MIQNKNPLKCQKMKIKKYQEKRVVKYQEKRVVTIKPKYSKPFDVADVWRSCETSIAQEQKKYTEYSQVDKNQLQREYRI